MSRWLMRLRRVRSASCPRPACRRRETRRQGHREKYLGPRVAGRRESYSRVRRRSGPRRLRARRRTSRARPGAASSWARWPAAPSGWPRAASAPPARPAASPSPSPSAWPAPDPRSSSETWPPSGASPSPSPRVVSCRRGPTPRGISVDPSRPARARSGRPSVTREPPSARDKI